MKMRFLILAFALLAAALAAGDDSAPALLAAGRADDAITTLHSKIIASPRDAEAYNLLCRAYFSMAIGTAALRIARKRSRSIPTTAATTCG